MEAFALTTEWKYMFCGNIPVAFTCSKLTIEKQEQGVKYVQS